MPHHRRRDSVQVQQLLQHTHLHATRAHNKLDLKDERITVLETDKIDKDTRMTALEASAVGIVDGGRANLQHVEATAINGGNASTT